MPAKSTIAGLLITSCCLWPAVARMGAQSPASPPLIDAMARLQSGDAAGAVAILKSLTAREPGNARAWRAYGIALQRTKAWADALTAFQKALDLDPGMVASIYNVAVVYASMGQLENAFSWLGKAKSTAKIDMTQIDADPAFAAMKKDPRFAALLPGPESFQHPFVEPVTVLREWDGEHANDQFGWIARNIGDVDSDGVADVVISAPSHASGGADAGRVYVYSTKSDRLLWKADGHAHDELGSGVEGAGDTNGDGIPDVVASAPGSGHAYVYSGRDGRVLLTLTAEGKDDHFGNHISGAGDVNHDGFADVIVGAPENNAGGAKAGRAYVYSGKDGRLLLTLTGERADDHFGSTVAGDGRFLVVGAPKAGARKTGRVYVYEGLSPTPKFTIESDETGAALGAMFIGVPGDIDGDGVPDIYASDWSNNALGWSTGRIYVHSGKTGKRLLTLTGETPGEGFGTCPAMAGDVDGDGAADLIVGSWQYGKAATSGGRAVLYSGRSGRVLRTFTNRIPGDTFGFDAVGLGDVDGDGTVDLLITSGWSGVHGFHSGRVFVVSSGVKRVRLMPRV